VLKALLKKWLIVVILTLQIIPTFSSENAINIEQIELQAKSGDPWSQLNYGAAFDHGLSGIVSDATKAVYWYRKSAEQGVANAQFNLGHCLATGHGVDQNYQEAFIWLEKAADQNIADAQFLVGIMYQEGMGVAVDRDKSEYWIKKAALNGHSSAQEVLARKK
jgi:TPR repeat protein